MKLLLPLVALAWLASTARAEETPAPAPSDSDAAPLSVRVICPQKAIIGELVRITTDTTGDVRELDWSIEPAVSSMLSTKDRRIAYLTTPTPGVYTIEVVVAGKTRGIARHKARIQFAFHDPNAKPQVEGPAGGGSGPVAATAPPDSPEAAKAAAVADVQRWADEIKSPTKARDTMDLITAFKMGRNLAEVKAFFTSTAGSSARNWNPFFKHIEEMLAEMAGKRQIPTDKHLLGFLTNVAASLEGRE